MSQAGFRYFTGVEPPAPYVNLLLSAPGSTRDRLKVPAQIDTGAYKTVIPLALVEPPGLTQVRELRVEGLDGAIVLLDTFLIELTIDGLSPVTVEALTSQAEVVVLLGRDVLNRYRIELNGRALVLTVTQSGV